MNLRYILHHVFSVFQQFSDTVDLLFFLSRFNFSEIRMVLV